MKTDECTNHQIRFASKGKQQQPKKTPSLGRSKTLNQTQKPSSHLQRIVTENKLKRPLALPLYGNALGGVKNISRISI